MCHTKRWTWGLALAVGLGLSTLAKADDDDVKPAKTGNWFSRMFTRDSAPKKKDAAAKDDVARPMSPSPVVIRKKAEGELLRRQEVCEKLRQIALETSDKELARKADDLEQRAWDIYVQRTGGPMSNSATEGPTPTSRLTARRD
jgi:hypothetical protein